MKFNSNNPAQRKLLYLIKTGLASSMLLDALEIPRRLLEAQQPYPEFNPGMVFVDRDLLSDLTHQLKALQLCLPEESCAPDLRQSKFLFMPFQWANKDPEEIFDNLTRYENPEVILNKYSNKTERMEQIKTQLKQTLEAHLEKGIMHCFTALASNVFQQLKWFNVILQQPLFQYEEDVAALKARFAERISVREPLLTSKHPRLFSPATLEGKRSTRGQTILDTLNAQRDIVDIESKDNFLTSPAFLFERVKNYIVTIERAEIAEHIPLNSQEFSLVEQGLLFMKKYMGPQEFQTALEEMNAIINEAIVKKDPKRPALYQLEKDFELGLENKGAKSNPLP